MPKRVLQILAVAAAAFVLVLACGKKAPPLPPIQIVPEDASSLSVLQMGDTMLFSFIPPSLNTDKKTPLEISRIEIYRMKELRTPPTQTQTAPQTQTARGPASTLQAGPQTQTKPAQ